MNSFILYISLYVFWYPLVMSTFWIIGGILFYYRRERKPALPLGLLAAKGEFLVGLDADAYLDPDALRYMIPHFITPNYGERVGAVTGNPRVRNRSSLLARIQLCEFSSIISLIKRTQRLLGKVMTVSGVVVVFRKSALLDCGLWDRDLITEDIGITWKLQKRFWDIRYEPRAICWMLVPETLVGLWKQRVRWAQGGLEVIMRHWNIFLINNTYYYNYSSYFNMCFCFNVFLGEI